MAETNYGISGVGSVSAHNLVVGPHGSIVENAVPAAFQAQLEELRAAITAFDGDAETKDRMAAATEDVAGELAAPKPDKPKLLERLAAISQAAGSVGAVTTAVTALISLVGVLL
jgi:hypothetical protein